MARRSPYYRQNLNATKEFTHAVPLEWRLPNESLLLEVLRAVHRIVFYHSQ